MQSPFDLLVVPTLVGLVQAVILAAVFAGSNRFRPTLSNWLLAALLACVSIITLGLVLAYTKSVLIFPHLGQVHNPFGFMPGPLLYLYARVQLSESKTLNRKDLLHFIPAVLLFIYLFPFYIQDSATKIAFLTEALNNFPTEWRIRGGLCLAQQLIYVTAAFLIFRKHTKSEQTATTIYRSEVYLVRFFIFTFAVISAVGAARFLISHRLETNLLVPSIASIMICGLIFRGLQSTQLVTETGVVEKVLSVPLPTPIDDSQLITVKELLEIEKIYLDKNLTLEKMARRMSVTPQRLSRIINEGFDQSFTNLINRYRVDEFQRRFADPANDRYTIAAIAEFSGFNSKSTFNAIFKKHTGMTPSEFKKLAN